MEGERISIWIKGYEVEIEVHHLLCILIGLISVSRGSRKMQEGKGRHVRADDSLVGNGFSWRLMETTAAGLDGLKAVETLKFSRPILVVTGRRIQPYAHARTP